MITMPNLVLGNVQQWISFYIHHQANSLIVVYSVLEYFIHFQSQTLCEKCPNTELFLVHAFFQVEWILRIRFVFTLYLSVFTLNAGKYGPEITPYLGTFHAVRTSELLVIFVQSNPVNPDKFVSSILRLDKQWGFSLKNWIFCPNNEKWKNYEVWKERVHMFQKYYTLALIWTKIRG